MRETQRRAGLAQDHPAGLWLCQNWSWDLLYSLGVLVSSYPRPQPLRNDMHKGPGRAGLLVHLEHTCYSAATRRRVLGIEA